MYIMYQDVTHSYTSKAANIIQCRHSLHMNAMLCASIGTVNLEQHVGEGSIFTTK